MALFLLPQITDLDAALSRSIVNVGFVVCERDSDHGRHLGLAVNVTILRHDAG